MADKWHSPVDRVRETCGAAFTVQYQPTRRAEGGRYCGARCNPRTKELTQRKVVLAIGAKRAEVDVVCIGCGQSFRTKVKNIARGGGSYCSRVCNPAYARRFEPSEKHRRHNLARNYGLSSVDFDRMRVSQKGRCAICRSLPDEPHGVLVVDHDHMTDRVRQLLCNNCNTAVGLLRDNPVTATELVVYLLRHDPDEVDRQIAISMLQDALFSEAKQ